MTTYEKIRYRDERGARHTCILRDPAEIQFLGAPALTGIEVNREGDEVTTNGADERRRIIATECVVRRLPMQWNTHYGILRVVA